MSLTITSCETIDEPPIEQKADSCERTTAGSNELPVSSKSLRNLKILNEIFEGLETQEAESTEK